MTEPDDIAIVRKYLPHSGTPWAKSNDALDRISDEMAKLRTELEAATKQATVSRDATRMLADDLVALADGGPVKSALAEAVRVKLETRGAVERCGGTSQMGCGRELSMVADGAHPIGYRCSECEQPFCATCIKGQKHATRWLEPCRDTELEDWANKAIAAQKRAKESEAELEALRAAPVPTASPWVSVEERMPEDGAPIWMVIASQPEPLPGERDGNWLDDDVTNSNVYPLDWLLFWKPRHVEPTPAPPEKSPQ